MPARSCSWFPSGQVVLACRLHVGRRRFVCNETSSPTKAGRSMEERKRSELRTEADNLAQHAAAIENCAFWCVPAHVFSSAVREAPQGTRPTEVEIKGDWDYRAPRLKYVFCRMHVARAGVREPISRNAACTSPGGSPCHRRHRSQMRGCFPAHGLTGRSNHPDHWRVACLLT